MRNITSTITKTIALLALAAALTGCMSFNPKSLRQMEAALQESNPDVEFESTVKFGVGALTMDFVDFALVHEAGVDVSKISRADVGIYEVKRGRLTLDEFEVPQGTSADCPLREVIVRVREEEEYVEIAVCMRGDKITGLTVFVLAPQEIVVVNCRGDFEAMVTSFVRDSHRRDRVDRS